MSSTSRRLPVRDERWTDRLRGRRRTGRRMRHAVARAPRCVRRFRRGAPPVRPVRVTARMRPPRRASTHREAPAAGTVESSAPGYQLSWNTPKRLWQRLFRSLWAQNRGAVGSGQQLTRDGVHLLEGDIVDLAEGVRDAAVFAVVELTAADAVHPGAGVLQPEHQPA